MDGRLGVSRPFHGENDSPAEADLLLEIHQAIPDLHFGLADFGDPVNHFPEGFGEPPGVKRPARLVEFFDFFWSHGGRGLALGRGVGHLGEEEGAAAGFEHFGNLEAEKGILPGENDLFPILEHGGKNLSPTVRFPELHPGISCPTDTGGNPKGEEEEPQEGGDPDPGFHNIRTTKNPGHPRPPLFILTNSARPGPFEKATAGGQTLLKISKRGLGCQGKTIDSGKPLAPSRSIWHDQAGSISFEGGRQ
jgi:hypothetical protein